MGGRRPSKAVRPPLGAAPGEIQPNRHDAEEFEPQRSMVQRDPAIAAGIAERCLQRFDCTAPTAVPVEG
jgi:hypothetical protein